jgi:hypothetical protein
MNIDPRLEVFSEYSDTHKMVHGFRPRFDWSKVTLEELTQMTNDLCKFANEEFTREQIEKQTSWISFRKKLQNLANDSQVSITTALHWIFSEYENDAYGTQLRDICHDYNLEYNKESVLFRMLRKGGYVKAVDFPMNNFTN